MIKMAIKTSMELTKRVPCVHNMKAIKFELLRVRAFKNSFFCA